ncbi:MAG: hypothetical protein KKD69_02715 [Euryarchaeota archaeon]|nr:hypothetical protein [Euryarchaeota archaeon]MCG2727689.1 hypothetical protein [Candidatus Methanoperedenaceae archaeon]
MLTRKQIEKHALKNRVQLFTQERDYIQAAYLSLLYSKTTSFLFKGPLYDGRDITKGLVRIDVSLRGKKVSEYMIPVRTEYDDVKTFIVGAATLDHIFAERCELCW